jgi:hypothetical protein
VLHVLRRPEAAKSWRHEHPLPHLTQRGLELRLVTVQDDDPDVLQEHPGRLEGRRPCAYGCYHSPLE